MEIVKGTQERYSVVNTEDLLRSIRRWIMVIALLLTIRIYYLASNGYNDAAGDLDDNILGLLAVGIGIIALISIVVSFRHIPTEEATHESNTDSR